LKQSDQPGADHAEDRSLLNRRIEESALNAWPALRQVVYDGWVLRFSKGFTKRANSVNALCPSTIDTGEKIAFCEARYQEQGLLPIFRITPFAPADLDPMLEERGYKKIDTTLVLHLDLGRCLVPPTEPLHEACIDEWLPIYCRLNNSPLDAHQVHREILETITGVCYPASLVVSGEPVSCALGVLEAGFFGLFDVVTALAHRNEGYATMLLFSMLGWACANGAVHAYLGVVETNAAARALYGKLGYQEAYAYWYRIPTL
jgi:GNAT superfamily N-acetyltransferase